MTDSEKVMRGLECCCTHIVGMSCGNCPYEIEQRENEGISDCTSVLAYDALVLLKEQETVEPKKTAYQRVDHTIACRYRCGTCDMSIFPSYKYCPFCGREVKWE